MSPMIAPKLYKGIEYVQLKELPPDQHIKIKESLNQDLFIKILVHGELYEHCILYKDYQYWFEHVFSPKATGAPIVSGDTRLLNSDPKNN